MLGMLYSSAFLFISHIAVHFEGTYITLDDRLGYCDYFQVGLILNRPYSLKKYVKDVL